MSDQAWPTLMGASITRVINHAMQITQMNTLAHVRNRHRL